MAVNLKPGVRVEVGVFAAVNLKPGVNIEGVLVGVILKPGIIVGFLCS